MLCGSSFKGNGGDEVSGGLFLRDGLESGC